MTEQIYTDKEILADALTAEKAATNNYNAFANECVHDSVRDAILHCLEQEHCIQEDVFNMMHQRGLYPTPDADANKVENTKQKFSQCVKTVKDKIKVYYFFRRKSVDPAEICAFPFCASHFFLTK